MLPSLPAGDSLDSAGTSFSVRGKTLPYSHRYVLRGLSQAQQTHFLATLKREVKRSGLKSGPGVNHLHNHFWKLGEKSIRQFSGDFSFFSQPSGLSELIQRPLVAVGISQEQKIEAIAYASEAGTPVVFTYRRRDETYRSYRMNVHRLHRDGFVGAFSRGYRRFSYARIEHFALEGKSPLTVGPELFVEVQVEPAPFRGSEVILRHFSPVA